jgi:NRE family putative nickel resistance protein-like MFS transporter
MAARAAIRRLALGRLLSMMGNDASGVAIGFAMYSQTHSTAWLSLSLLLTIGAGSVLAPIGGWLGDHLPRRPLMIASEASAAVLFATLGFVHDPGVLLAAGLLAASIGAVFGPASGAAIGYIAGPGDLNWANGQISASSNVGKTVGRFGAGGLIALGGTGAVFFFDAATFVISALLIFSIAAPFGGLVDGARSGERAVTAGTTGSVRRAGASLALLDSRIRAVLLAACVATFATSFSMTAEVPLVFELGGGAIALGALTACWALGMVAGSWYAGRVLHAGNEVTGVLTGRVLMGVSIASVSLAGTLTPALLSYVLGGLGGGFMGVAASSLVLRRAPDEMRARVIGTMEACRNVSFGVGVIAAGFVVAPLGPSTTYAFVGSAVVIGCVPLARLLHRLGGLRPLRPAQVAAEASAPANA